MLFARCIGTAFILGHMGCIKKHTTLWWLWNEHFILSNYYSEDKSDHYFIEMLPREYHAYRFMSWEMIYGFYAARDYACLMQPHTKIFFPSITLPRRDLLIAACNLSRQFKYT